MIYPWAPPSTLQHSAIISTSPAMLCSALCSSFIFYSLLSLSLYNTTVPYQLLREVSGSELMSANLTLIFELPPHLRP